MYWDSSALIPILLPESRSVELTSVLESDAEPTVWWGTTVECQSAIYRRHLESPMRPETIAESLKRLEAFLNGSDVVNPSEEVRIRAGRLLSLHPLRAADALQLAAALVWSREAPLEETFVCLDERLREAARREGFRLIPA